tara:strand:- start:1350 stop:1670 length:321 start_codon:yes stop_codon:yes gene_type:complete
MKKGTFLWLCGEYMVLVQVELDADLCGLANNYHLELDRENLLLRVNGDALLLDDENVELYRVKKGVTLAEVKSHEDYNPLALPIDRFSGVPSLLSGRFSLLSAAVK